MFEFQESVHESELKLPQRFGAFPRWPEDGTDWIHPDDVQLVEGLIPSRRIFERHRLNGDNEYSKVCYGELSIRIRPVLWLEVKTDGYLIGDRVEIRSRMGAKKPDIASIQEMFWDRKRAMVEYRLSVRDQEQSSSYYLGDFQPAFQLGEPLSPRQADLLAKSRLM